MNEKEKNDKQNSLFICNGYSIFCNKLHHGSCIVLAARLAAIKLTQPLRLPLKSKTYSYTACRITRNEGGDIIYH